MARGAQPSDGRLARQAQAASHPASGCISAPQCGIVRNLESKGRPLQTAAPSIPSTPGHGKVGGGPPEYASASYSGSWGSVHHALVAS
jgi:hypothetical protein